MGTIENYSYMTDNFNQPKHYDAVIGGQNSPPVSGVILGGLDAVKQRFSSGNVEQKIAALYDALNYGKPGLDLIIEALNDESGQVGQAAFWLLPGKSRFSLSA